MNEAIRPVARRYLDGRDAHRRPPQPHRGGDPRLRSLPVLRDACARPDAARGRAGRGATVRAWTVSRATAAAAARAIAQPEHAAARRSCVGQRKSRRRRPGTRVPRACRGAGRPARRGDDLRRRLPAPARARDRPRRARPRTLRRRVAGRRGAVRVPAPRSRAHRDVFHAWRPAGRRARRLCRHVRTRGAAGIRTRNPRRDVRARHAAGRGRSHAPRRGARVLRGTAADPTDRAWRALAGEPALRARDAPVPRFAHRFTLPATRGARGSRPTSRRAPVRGCRPARRPRACR